MTHPRFALLSAAIGIAAAVPAFAQDKADIDRTQIIGNRELPKVLYIVPWKKPMPGDLSGRPLVSVLDEALAPLDRDVFRRELKYDAVMQVRAPAATSAAAVAAKPVAAPITAPVTAPAAAAVPATPAARP
jgi:hypothetical protein